MKKSTKNKINKFLPDINNLFCFLLQNQFEFHWADRDELQSNKITFDDILIKEVLKTAFINIRIEELNSTILLTSQIIIKKHGDICHDHKLFNIIIDGNKIHVPEEFERIIFHEAENFVSTSLKEETILSEEAWEQIKNLNLFPNIEKIGYGAWLEMCKDPYCMDAFFHNIKVNYLLFPLEKHFHQICLIDIQDPDHNIDTLTIDLALTCYEKMCEYFQQAQISFENKKIFEWIQNSNRAFYFLTQTLEHLNSIEKPIDMNVLS